MLPVVNGGSRGTENDSLVIELLEQIRIPNNPLARHAAFLGWCTCLLKLCPHTSRPDPKSITPVPESIVPCLHLQVFVPVH